MPTKTFSCRAEESALAFADNLAHKEYGLSFGQYCGTVLLDIIERTGALPTLPHSEINTRKAHAARFIKGFANKASNPEIGLLSDQEVRALIASRYQ